MLKSHRPSCESVELCIIFVPAFEFEYEHLNDPSLTLLTVLATVGCIATEEYSLYSSERFIAT